MGNLNVKNVYSIDHVYYLYIYVYICIYIYVYIYMRNDWVLRFAQALQRRGFPIPIKCCCNFTFTWEDQKLLRNIRIRPPLNSTFHWEDQQRC
jgi:hypothetical protein